MEWKQASLMARGYWFFGRNLLAGKITNKVLDLLAFLDYRLLMLLSMWHPDHASRIKLLRRRGVNISEKAWVDIGVFIEMTTPQSVIIEDYAKLAYGVTVYAHDASFNSAGDLPMRVQETRIGTMRPSGPVHSSCPVSISTIMPAWLRARWSPRTCLQA